MTTGSTESAVNRNRAAIVLSAPAWRSIVLYIAAAALLLRLIELHVKPLHHDEGVNAFFLANLVRPPHAYRYDPTNYHGPTLYYLAWISASIFGLTDFALRFVPAMFGLLTIALVLALRRPLGDVGAVTAALALTLSPGAVFHSRYFIHESLLVGSTLGLVVASYKYFDERRASSLVLAAMAAAGMTATKETWIISAGVLVCACVGTIVWCRWRGATRLGPLPRVGLGVVIAAIAVFAAVNLLLYTSLLTNWTGAVDAVRALDVWAKTGQAQHTQPWYTYIAWLAGHELPLLVLGVAGAGVAFWRGREPFAVFAGLWALGTLAAYSLIPYKTPWLTLNMLPPLALLAGWLAETLTNIASARWRRAGVLAGIAIGVGTIYQTIALNFIGYDNERYGYVYVQTSREIRGLVGRISDVLGRAPERVPVIVMSPDQFPLSWYLRDVAASYPGRVEPATQGIVVASQRQAEEVASVLGDRFVRQGEYKLRDGVVLVLYVSRDLVAN